MPVTPSGRDVYRDVPLGQLALKAFQGGEGFIAPVAFSAVDVPKPSGQYYELDPAAWLQVPNAFRGPGDSPNRIGWKINSNGYATKNYALANEVTLEDVAAADAAIRIRENAVRVIVEALNRDLEVRIANLVTSATNVGSGNILAGTNRWSDFLNSNPLADVRTGHAFIRQRTGLTANAALMDEDTFQVLRDHPDVVDRFKYVAGGMVSLEQLAGVLRVDRILIGRGVKNVANPGQTSSIVNIWGNNCLLARIEAATGLETATLGLRFQFTPEGIPGPFQVERYAHWDPGKKIEIVQAGYYSDEKIVAKDLGYLIATTL